MAEWLPIDSVPKDGTTVLVWPAKKPPKACFAKWHEGRLVSLPNCQPMPTVNKPPTHWRQMVDLPE